MRRFLITFIALGAAVGLARVDGAPAAEPGATHVLQQEAGKALFAGKGNCFTCHRQDAKGTPLAPDLTDNEWVNFESRPTQEQVVELIKEGVARPQEHPAPMPPMGGGSLSDEEVAQLAGYVLSLSEETDG